MLVVALAVESMGGTVVGMGSVTLRGLGAKVQPQLGRALMAVHSPARIHQSAQPVGCPPKVGPREMEVPR